MKKLTCLTLVLANILCMMISVNASDLSEEAKKDFLKSRNADRSAEKKEGQQ